MKEKMIRKNYRLDEKTAERLSHIQDYFHISESEAVRLAIKEFFHTEFGMRLVPAAAIQSCIDNNRLSYFAIVLVDDLDFREDSGAINLSPALIDRSPEDFVERYLELRNEDDDLPF